MMGIGRPELALCLTNDERRDRARTRARTHANARTPAHTGARGNAPGWDLPRSRATHAGTLTRALAPYVPVCGPRLRQVIASACIDARTPQRSRAHPAAPTWQVNWDTSAWVCGAGSLGHWDAPRRACVMMIPPTRLLKGVIMRGGGAAAAGSTLTLRPASPKAHTSNL